MTSSNPSSQSSENPGEDKAEEVKEPERIEDTMKTRVSKSAELTTI